MTNARITISSFSSRESKGRVSSGPVKFPWELYAPFHTTTTIADIILHIYDGNYACAMWCYPCQLCILISFLGLAIVRDCALFCAMFPLVIHTTYIPILYARFMFLRVAIILRAANSNKQWRWKDLSNNKGRQLRKLFVSRVKFNLWEWYLYEIFLIEFFVRLLHSLE